MRWLVPLRWRSCRVDGAELAFPSSLLCPFLFLCPLPLALSLQSLLVGRSDEPLGDLPHLLLLSLPLLHLHPSLLHLPLALTRLTGTQ